MKFNAEHATDKLRQYWPTDNVMLLCNKCDISYIYIYSYTFCLNDE